MAETSEAQRWDDRYRTDGFIFGTAPADFLTNLAHMFEPGASALVVADGEGRNSVFLAEHGLDVTAMDVSQVGVDKACALAATREVSVDFSVADILTWSWQPETYDLVVAVFIQFLPPDQRSLVFEGLQRALKPGGRLLLHGYRPEQLEYATGGPPIADYMYTEELLAEAFSELVIERLAAYDAELDEGPAHSGMSALIDLVARKPSA